MIRTTTLRAARTERYLNEMLLVELQLRLGENILDARTRA